MLFSWCPKVTVMIHQQIIVWMCTINSSCTEYVIISKHLWIVIAPWLRLSLSITSSFIPLICRTTIFHSDCLAWIFISVLFFPPYPSLFIAHLFKKQSSCDPHGWDNLSDRYTPLPTWQSFSFHRPTLPPSGFLDIFWGKKASVRSTWLLYCFKSQSSNLVKSFGAAMCI